MGVRENGKVQLIFMHVPNIQKILERFYRMQDLYSLIPNFPNYRLILSALKFFKRSQGNLKFSLAIY